MNKCFDIIGDVHSCGSELIAMLELLGYLPSENLFDYAHPENRQIVFVGDLTDRGPKSCLVLSIVQAMIKSGSALSVLGNHDDKLLRYLKGRNVKISHGLDLTIDQIEENIQPDKKEQFKNGVVEMLEKTPYYLVLDDGKLIVSHAGLEESLHGKDGPRVKTFCLYGKIENGKTDEFGYPIRKDWATEYNGQATVVFGHTVVEHVLIKNKTFNIDTGCVFGGRLSALSWPSLEIVQVKSREIYSHRLNL